MSLNGKTFRSWVLAQQVLGARPYALDDNRIRIDAGTAVAEVNFYPYQGDMEIAEYQIVRTSDSEAIFYLHVLLDDLSRARELFAEMADALEEETHHTTTRVLLCCTSALTTTLFASKMNEVAKTLALDYDFSALSVDRALVTEDPFGAILLAPQASHMRAQMAEAHPNSLVFEIPGKIFGSYDAAAAVRLVMHAFRESRPHSAARGSLRIARDLSNAYRILIITIFTHRTYSRLGFRLFEGGEMTAHGSVRKPKLDYRDIEDLLETMGARGVSVADLDIIGIAVPGVAYHGAVSLPGIIDDDYELGKHIEGRFGIRTSVDNNCNAAAVGCYVAQDQYESVMFYRHELGHVAGGLGTVIDGTLLKGRHNLAGEPKYYESRFAYETSYSDALWSEEGLFSLACNVTANGIALISPEAFYLAVDTVDDMEALRRALAEDLPEELVPPLFVVDDYVERVYLGEMALCLQKLRDPEYHSLGIA